jgi:hypothetical protein
MKRLFRGLTDIWSFNHLGGWEGWMGRVDGKGGMEATTADVLGDCRRVHAGNVDARLEVSRARKEGTCENPASKGTAMSARNIPHMIVFPSRQKS